MDSNVHNWPDDSSNQQYWFLWICATALPACLILQFDSQGDSWLLSRCGFFRVLRTGPPLVDKALPMRIPLPVRWCGHGHFRVHLPNQESSRRPAKSAIRCLRNKHRFPCSFGLPDDRYGSMNRGDLYQMFLEFPVCFRRSVTSNHDPDEDWKVALWHTSTVWMPAKVVDMFAEWTIHRILIADRLVFFRLPVLP